MQKATSFVKSDAFEEDERGMPHLDPQTIMAEVYSKENSELHECWNEIQKIVPPGFAIDGNLVRHLSFNEASDWHDITNNDIPRELTKIEEYEKKIILIQYIDTLHPDVSRVTSIVLDGDIDAALKIIYTALDSKIRSLIKAKPGESTVPTIGKAFKDKLLIPPHPNHYESVRNFLQGVLGYYRSIIAHNTLPPQRDSIPESLSLFGLAHEALVLIDHCSKAKNS